MFQKGSRRLENVPEGLIRYNTGSNGFRRLYIYNGYIEYMTHLICPKWSHSLDAVFLVSSGQYADLLI